MKKINKIIPLVFLLAIAAILIINSKDSSLRKTKLNIVSNSAVASGSVMSFIVVSDGTTMVESNDIKQNAVATWVHPAWTASIPGPTWIWESYLVKNPRVEETLVFTKEFYIPGNPLQSGLRIAADNGYIVYLNGKLVGSDIAGNNFVSGGEDNYDVLSKTIGGKNLLQVTVTNFPSSGDSYANPGGLLFKLNIAYESWY